MVQSKHALNGVEPATHLLYGIQADGSTLTGVRFQVMLPATAPFAAYRGSVIEIVLAEMERFEPQTPLISH